VRSSTWLLALVLSLVFSRSTLGAPSESPFHMHLTGLEIAYPAYVKSGSSYTMTGLRFAGIALGDRPGVWLVDLRASGPLGADNEPLHCTPDSAMTITGGTWVLRTWSGEIRGQVTSGLIAFRPDLPIFGRCTGPVPATLTVTISSATGRYASVLVAAMSHSAVDHRLVPATIAADVVLEEQP
jgi:hypothetical protein